MNIPDVAVIAAGLALSVFLAWFFFGPKKSWEAELGGHGTEVPSMVKARRDAYS